MRATSTRRLTSLLVLVMLLSAFTPSFARSPLTVKVPVDVIEEGSVADGKTYQVIFSADDVNYPMPEGSQNGRLVLEVQAGSYDIPIVFNEVGYYYYTISQEKGDDPLADYSDRVYHLTVFVSFTETGELESTVVLKEEGATEKQAMAEFLNVWVPEGKWAPEVTKQLDGRDLKAEEFTFVLKEGDKVLQTKKNDQAGKVVFDDITFRQPGLYKYVIEEIKGYAYGVTYDDVPKQIELQVIDNGKGVLTFKPSHGEGGLVFKNKYQLPTTDIVVTKKWVGGPDKKPVIHFQLYRDGKAFGDIVKLEGKTQHTWKGLDKTDVEGKVYRYTVKETVVPNGYKVTYSEDSLTITNTWIKEELPSTGVGSNLPFILLVLGLMVVSSYLRRKSHI